MSLLSWLKSLSIKNQQRDFFAKTQQDIVDKIAASNAAATLKQENATVPGYIASPTSAQVQAAKNTILSTSNNLLSMNTLTILWNWIKSNILLSVGVLIIVLLLFFPKVLKGLFGTTRRVVHHRRVHVAAVRHRRHVHHAITGTHRRRPAARRRSHGSKKPWQIKGSRAAKLRMARLRRLR